MEINGKRYATSLRRTLSAINLYTNKLCAHGAYRGLGRGELPCCVPREISVV